MKYGIREICDVVLKAKSNMQVGNKLFYKNEPVIYFDTLKTSTLEGAATTVYATGGRGNSRLMAWEGERTVTFTMEDALISTAGIMILTGAGLVDGTQGDGIQVHCVETVNNSESEGVTVTDSTVTITVDQPLSAHKDATIYVMPLNANGDIITEPFIGTGEADGTTIEVKAGENYAVTDIAKFADCAAILIDYYTDKKTEGAQQIEITPDKFGGYFYLEASTLFRDTNGVDLPAEFIIPNCKVQSNFTFTMASSGDPSTFTFTMDAFPDYTRFDKTKKVLCAIQVIGSSEEKKDAAREATNSAKKLNDLGELVPKA